MVVKLSEDQRRKYVLKEYNKYIKSHNNVGQIKKSYGRIVIYTAIMGDYDDLTDPMYINSECDYICFTNNAALKSKVWKIVFVEDSTLSDAGLARKIKFFPHMYLREYSLSIWVDSKFIIKGDLLEYYFRYGNSSGMLCFLHYERNSIRDEAEACIEYKRGSRREIIAQLEDYQNNCFPDTVGLFETGCIVREHHLPKIVCLMQLWWDELQRHSIRDQISLPYACWKLDFYPSVSDLYINDNAWTRSKPHKKNNELLYEYILPYHLLSSGESVIIYGANRIGKSFYLQGKKSKFIKVVGIVDSIDQEEVISGLSIEPVKFVFFKNFDSILLAIEDKNVAMEVKKSLVNQGIHSTQIKWDGEKYSTDRFIENYIGLLRRIRNN